jgi:uncharacterized protein (DUF2141 family)
MKAAILALAGWALLGLGAAQAGEVRVTLTHVQHRPGQVLAALQTEQQFRNGPGDYNLAAPAQAGDVTLDFADVAPGEYALAVLHDEDGDMRMKRDADGHPLEGWALSNGDVLRGPPSFAIAKFTVGASGVVTLHADMHYPPASAGQ